MFIKINNLSKFYNNYLAVNKISFEIEKIKQLDCLGQMVVEKLQLLVCC